MKRGELAKKKRKGCLTALLVVWAVFMVKVIAVLNPGFPEAWRMVEAGQIAGFAYIWLLVFLVENPLKVAPLIQSNLTPVKFFHSFILFILVFFVFFLSVMPGSTLNFVYKYNDSFLLLHLRSDSPKSSIRIA